MPNILLIDDNRYFRLGLAANLRKEGFEVATAANGAEGIQLAHDLLPELILCDVKMPDRNGMAVQLALNSEPATADIPFVFLSGLSDSSIKSCGLCAGAEDYITKPVDLDELIARIQAILRRKERAVQRSKQDVLQLLENIKTTLPIHTSHLFRTYIGILFLALEMVKKSDSSTEQDILLAYESAYRLKFLVNDLIGLNELDLGRFPMLREHIDLESAFTIPINEALEVWKRKNLRFEIAMNDGLVIITPPRAFTQTVCRLVDNACKFSPVGGLIQIALRDNGVGGCVFSVQDQGPGIPVQLHEQVFERFYQIPNEENLPQNYGLGLGLYLARTFARQQGGDVRIIDSASGCKVQMWLGKNRLA